jgi:prolyl oligopeptidase
LEQVAKDFVGTVSLSAKREESWFFATLVSFTTPGTIAKYNFKESDKDKRWSVYRETNVKGVKAGDFKSEQVWYTSKDGTRVPMFVVKHKDTPEDGTAPALQYGYGGFSISIGPFFSSAMLSFLQKYRAVLAVPNIRGGGEFGEEWHIAGTREKKVADFFSTRYFERH